MTIRAVIVDDEGLARRGIRALLSRVSDVEIVAECINAGEAIEAIQSEQPDLVFLDIEMPEAPGFGVTLHRVRRALADARERSISFGKSCFIDDRNRLTEHPVHRAVDRIPVKSGGRVVVIRIADVDWVKAEQDYTSLFVGEKSWLVKETIGAIEDRFASAGFVRIHRSTLVNVDRVKELRRLDKGEYRVVPSTGVILKLSRNYRVALPHLVGSLV